MLDLIVLGLVPGTAIQITFPQVAVTTIFLLIFLLLRHEVKYSRRLILKLSNFKQLIDLIKYTPY